MSGIIYPGLMAQDIRFLEKIGEGADAEVWKVQELASSKRDLAAKVVAVPFELRAEHEYAQQVGRIQDQEALYWGKISPSPYVVPLYGPISDIVTVGDEKYLIAGCKMPLADLGDLGKYLRNDQLKLQGKKDLIRFLLALARGVKAAHEVNVAHCDIKASNVLLFRNGADVSPQIMDFSISVGTTISIAHGGTPEYMAPEQFAAGGNLNLDEAKRADVYSLGILFYEVTCQRLPYEARCETEKERWDTYKRLHQTETLDEHLLVEKSDEQLAKLVSRMLHKEARMRIPVYKVVQELERLEVDSIVTTWTARELPNIVREGTYRWSVHVHHTLANQLCYYLVRGKQVSADIDWFKNNLKEKGIHGYSFYRILGGYDYLIRVWLKATYATLMNRTLEEFSKTKGGSYASFAAQYIKLFDESKALDFNTPDDLLDAICICAHPEDAEEEYHDLKDACLVTSRFDHATDPFIRFFVVLNSGDKISDHYWKMLANSLRGDLLQRYDSLQQLSVYTGSGDFSMLVKFRLPKFFDYRYVVETFIELVSEARNEADVRFQTFVELDESGFIESDDGSIVREASVYHDRMY